MKRSIEVVREAVRTDRVSYGITTGFGAFANKRISADQVRQLQLNLVRSHACGVGVPLSEPEVRAMMVLRANVLALGFSGIRREVLELLTQMLNRGVHPMIPEKGSVGASGDLAPLAHLALALVGEGEAFFKGERMSSGVALERARQHAVNGEHGHHQHYAQRHREHGEGRSDPSLLNAAPSDGNQAHDDSVR
jgi:histidine ammonia-lyase